MKTIIYDNYSDFLDDCKKLNKESGDNFRMIYKDVDITARKILNCKEVLYDDIQFLIGRDFIMVINKKSYRPNSGELFNKTFNEFITN